MPQLDKLTYFSQFFWLCLLLFTFYILLFNNNNGILGISRILKLRNQSLHGGEIRARTLRMEDISRKGFSTVSHICTPVYPSIPMWLTRNGETDSLFDLKSSYNTSSSRITCWKNIMLTHVPHGEGSIIL
ncbi:hypothetical protein ZWY2020_060067 [Hordeum vulgare]|nr:hypothetical protein ZWY2020_060067 [Hordeum vulgare]